MSKFTETRLAFVGLVASVKQGTSAKGPFTTVRITREGKKGTLPVFLEGHVSPAVGSTLKGEGNLTGRKWVGRDQKPMFSTGVTNVTLAA